MQRTELLNAIKLGDKDRIIKMKNTGFPLNKTMKGEYGYSTEHIKLATPYPDIIKLLIEWELETDKWFANCMLEGSVYDNNPVLAAVSIELGAKVNGESSYRNHIIDIVLGNKIDLCRIFVNAGVDLSITDEYGRGVFHYVQTHEMMDLIISHMVCDHEDEWGKTAYQTHNECIPNGNGYKPINHKLRIELGNRIAKQLSESKL